MRSRQLADRTNKFLRNFGHDTDNLLRCASSNFCGSGDSTKQWDAHLRNVSRP